MSAASIRLKTLLSFGAILAVLVTIGGFAHVRLARIEADAVVLRNVDAVGGADLAGLIYELSDGFVRAVDFTLEPTAANRAALEAVLGASSARNSLQVAGDGPEREAIRALAAALDAMRRAELDALNNTAVALPPEDRAALRRDRLRPAFDAALTAAGRVLERVQADRAAAAEQLQAHAHSIRLALLASIGAALLIALVAGLHLMRAINAPLRNLLAHMELVRGGDFSQRMAAGRRDEFGALSDGFNRMADEVMGLVGQVQKSGVRVNTSMTQIAATSKEQQATASEIAATTIEIGATSREISATSKELVRTMNEVAVVAENAAGVASAGKAGLSEMSTTMANVMDAAATINAKLAVLNEKAGNINQVVTTITKVADQTNLLSLNAAIEAEKAGEYGRGFAVVSSEIRRLADQTAVATLDIEEMVKEIQAAVSAGVMGMDKFSEEVRSGMRSVQDVGARLSEVIAEVQTLVPRFEAVNDGMEAQAMAAEQISEALQQLTETTQQTAESLRQSNDAIDELNRVSGSLHGSISRFRLVA